VNDEIAILNKFFGAIPPQIAPEKLQTALEGITRFRAVLQRLEAQITFFGAFKAGKSTLLNAILGWSVLPSRTNRATGVVTKLGYGEQIAAHIVRHSGKQEPIFFDDLPRYILLDLSSTTASAPADIAEVHIRIPFDFLKGRGVLVDSPGLMDNQGLTERTVRELENTDLAVMVLSADKLVSQVERQMAQHANLILGGNLVFIINRLDLIDDEEREDVIAWATSAFDGLGNRLVGQPRIFATEAKATLEARKRAGHNGETGLLEFEKWLAEVLDSPQGNRMRLVARLGLLQQHLARTRDLLESGLAETQQRAIFLEKQAEQEAQFRRNEFRREIASNRERLTRYRYQLEAQGVRFLEDCTWNLQRLSQTVPDWERRLSEAFEPALQIYARNIYQGIRAGLSLADFKAPMFALRPRNLQEQTDNIAGQSVGNWFNQTFGVDVGAGAQNLTDWFSRTIPGRGAGASDEQRQRRLVAAEQTARQLVPSLREEAEIYIQKIDRLLVEYEETHQPKQVAPPEAALTRQSEQNYSHFLKWCVEFQAAVANLQKQLL
jgi:hypothetical protein